MHDIEQPRNRHPLTSVLAAVLAMAAAYMLVGPGVAAVAAGVIAAVAIAVQMLRPDRSES